MRTWRTLLLAIALPILLAATVTVASATAHESAHATARAASAPVSSAPVATNDLLPQTDLSNCVGTVEQPNCGSRARADGHTYLVFLALVLGMTFIGWRVARGVRARDAAQSPRH